MSCTQLSRDAQVLRYGAALPLWLFPTWQADSRRCPEQSRSFIERQFAYDGSHGVIVNYVTLSARSSHPRLWNKIINLVELSINLPVDLLAIVHILVARDR